MNHQQNLCDVRNVDIHGEITVKVKAQSKENKIEIIDKLINIWVKAPADKNKANIAVIKALTKFFNRPFKIKRGLKNKIKIISF